MNIRAGKILKLKPVSEAYWKYRSHIGKLQCSEEEANNWMRIDCIDEHGEEYAAWYRIDGKEYDEIDYSAPTDVTKDGKIIYENVGV